MAGSWEQAVIVERNITHDLNWYAIRAVPRHEKRVRDRLETRQVECFLPTMKSHNRWKNGQRPEIEVPLFPTYLFVRTTLQQRLTVLGTEGVNCFVGAAGTPWPIADQEIEILQSALPRINCRPHHALTEGDKVKIIAGPLAGLSGIVLRDSGQFRVVLTVSVIMQGVSVEIDTSHLERIN
jgi:transcription elongation factor/antiterminator RfaH